MKLKKFLIGIIFVLAVIIILCLSLVLKNRYNLKVSSNSENQVMDTIAQQEIQEENIIQENKIIENETIKFIEQDVIEETTEESSTPSVTQNTAQEKTSSTNQSTKNTSNSQTQVTQQEIQVQTKVETVIPTTTQEQQKVTEEKTETATPSSPSTQVITKDEEKYIRNDNMISKIKNVINSNPSEYMQTYGYEVIVDSSIKEKTNQFTFTETRVKGFITYKFGTIRIYAEDYYKNGQLIMTECYIY